MRRYLIPVLALASLATPALAHPKLVSATPAAGSSVAPTNHIDLKFSEKLIAQFSSATLEMTGMPGMATHAPMKMKVATAVSADGLTLSVTLPKPLPKGTYKLSYNIVSADTHRIEDGYSFTVR